MVHTIREIIAAVPKEKFKDLPTLATHINRHPFPFVMFEAIPAHSYSINHPLLLSEAKALTLMQEYKALLDENIQQKTLDKFNTLFNLKLSKNML